MTYLGMQEWRGHVALLAFASMRTRRNRYANATKYIQTVEIDFSLRLSNGHTLRA